MPSSNGSRRAAQIVAMRIAQGKNDPPRGFPERTPGFSQRSVTPRSAPFGVLREDMGGSKDPPPMFTGEGLHF